LLPSSSSSLTPLILPTERFRIIVLETDNDVESYPLLSSSLSSASIATTVAVFHFNKGTPPDSLNQQVLSDE
jgi:hypothetical protein